ncbi:DUF6932 family protein [Providencia rettgeri]|uniref:DUF6932 family protein n=1 Tax=Providencia rettgeri TaxID=587 RepID=UPI0023600337|nr:hypothetical protein [Providencia rettgeri]
MNNTIPEWNESGIIPPIGESSSVGFNRSPYKTTSIELVERYAFNKKRANILIGFLKFRARLYSIGLTTGFQWVDGSFTENVELTESRKPNDIDLVTFFYIPQNETQTSLVNKDLELFTSKMKDLYLVDSYWQILNSDPITLVEMTVYWYSMWAHKRDMSWKGFLQIPLSEEDDLQANTLLQNLISGGFDE